ncbi:embryonic protein DC-8-like [Panicum miliaceum]|uniref:Embryonic protein DC-8-like n=1 Tax=Panicum miliaceum TaxID=4540 RepID=A0A3L6RRR7_PANMI|nr:embryonic protein DC-8-like [Panicum miliaceum]
MPIHHQAASHVQSNTATHAPLLALDAPYCAFAGKLDRPMASQQQPRKQATTKGQEEGGQGQAMNLEEIGKYRAEAQQRSADAIRAAEERFNKANNQQPRGAAAVAQAPGATVVSSYQETTKQPAATQQGESPGAHGTDAQQWLAQTAADARERCNKAMGTSPAAHALAGGAAPHDHGKEEQEGGGQARAHLTRQEEMGRPDAEAARAAVEKHDRGGAAEGQGVKDKATRAAGATADHAAAKGAEAKDAGARGAHAAAGKAREAEEPGHVTAAGAEDSASQAADKASRGDTASHAEDKAAEVKDRASFTGKAAGGGVTTKAKVRAAPVVQPPDGSAVMQGAAGEEEGGTTIVGDVLEAVGATVVGLAQHAKGLVAGEEELVPVEREEGKVAGGTKEEKRKTA